MHIVQEGVNNAVASYMQSQAHSVSIFDFKKYQFRRELGISFHDLQIINLLLYFHTNAVLPDITEVNKVFIIILPIFYEFVQSEEGDV